MPNNPQLGESPKRLRTLLATVDFLLALASKRRVCAVIVTGVTAIGVLCCSGFLLLSLPDCCFWLWTTPTIRDIPIPTPAGAREAWRVGFDGLRSARAAGAPFFRRAALTEYPLEIRQFAMWALARDHPAVAMDVLSQLLKDAEARIRQAACEFLMEETFHNYVVSRGVLWKDGGAEAKYGSLGYSLVVYHERERSRDPTWSAALETLQQGDPEYFAPVREPQRGRIQAKPEVFTYHVNFDEKAKRVLTTPVKGWPQYNLPAMLTQDDIVALRAAGLLDADNGGVGGTRLFPLGR